METKKNIAAVVALTVVVLLLCAFSDVDAWSQAADRLNSTETMSEEMVLLQNTGAGEAQTEGLGTEGESQSETESQPESEPQSETESQPESEPQSETESQPESESQSESESQPESESQSETESQPEGESQSETENQPESESQSETESQPETEAAVQTVDYFAGQFVVTVEGKTALNVREEPSTDSKWVGKMYEGSGGTILEVGDGWTKIESGNVVGWVSNDYILTGEAGLAKVMEICELVFEVKSDALKVRSAPTTEEDNKVRAIYGGETYPVVSVREDGWVEIEYKEEKTGWVAGQYGRIYYGYETGMTREEIALAEAEKKRVEVATTNRETTSATDDEIYLLACLINCESNHYEGQLAVANVVLNRVKSPRFPNTISDVIYSPGQFSPARSGKLARRLESGPSASAMQAARDALNGTNNIGDYLFFRSYASADVTKYAAYTVVAGNCFYRK